MNKNISDTKQPSVMPCRACLQSFEEEDFLEVDVIYDENEKLTYADCFFICTQTNLVESKALPYNLCKECGLELQIAYDFHKKVKEANKVLENIFLDEGKLIEFEAVNVFPSDEDDYNVGPTTSAAENETKRSTPDPQPVDAKFNLEEEAFASAEELVDFEWDENNFSEKSNAEEDSKPAIDEEKEIKKRKDTKPKNSKERSKYCDICHKTFSDPSYLPRHRRIHDPQRERKIYECPQCDKSFPTTSQVKIHLRSHTGEGYLCPVCSKLLYTRHDLEVHMRFHTRDFPFVCDVCGKNFALKVHLTYHMSAKHNGLRLSCKDCGKHFQNVSSLRAHSYVHSEMPFHCDHCEKKYPTKHKLKVHIKTKHGIEPSNEELEGMRKVQSEKYNHGHTWTKVETIEDEIDGALTPNSVQEQGSN